MTPEVEEAEAPTEADYVHISDHLHQAREAEAKGYAQAIEDAVNVVLADPGASLQTIAKAIRTLSPTTDEADND